MPHIMMSASSAAAARRARNRAQLRAQMGNDKEASEQPQPKPERPPSPVYPNPDNACLMTICLNCVPDSSPTVQRLNRILVISNWIFIALVIVSVVLMLSPFFSSQAFLQSLRTFGYVIVGLSLFGILVNAIFLRRMLYGEIRKMKGEKVPRVPRIRRSNEVAPVNKPTPVQPRPASALPQKTQPQEQSEDSGSRPLPPMFAILPPPAVAGRSTGIMPQKALPSISFVPLDSFGNQKLTPLKVLSPRSQQDNQSTEMWPSVNQNHSRIHLPPLGRPEAKMNSKPGSEKSYRVTLPNDQEMPVDSDDARNATADHDNFKSDSFQSETVPDDSSGSEYSDTTPNDRKKSGTVTKPVYTSSEEDEL